MPFAEPSTAGNRLLLALPRKDRRRFLAGCAPVDLVYSDVIAEHGTRIAHVYFPTGGLISLTTQTDIRTGLAVGLVGDEGMLGVSLILGVDIAPLRAVVQGDGPALRMDTARFRRELATSASLQQELNRYLYVTMRQIAQSAACARFHRVEERLARWLLMTHDRAHSDEIHVTHQFLAYVLGVRRVGVTLAATTLQERTLIRYRRGRIWVLDRAGLEAAACRCYAADNAAYTRTMA